MIDPKFAGQLLAGWLPLVLTAGAWAGDFEDIQGTWTVTAVAQGRRAAGEDEVKKAALEATFLGATCTMRGAAQAPIVGTDFRRQGTFRLDPSKDPRTIDLTSVSLVRDKRVRATELGIYRLDGNALTILITPPGRARPTGFPPEAADGTLLVLTRRQPAAQSGSATAANPPARPPSPPAPRAIRSSGGGPGSPEGPRPSAPTGPRSTTPGTSGPGNAGTRPGASTPSGGASAASSIPSPCRRTARTSPAPIRWASASPPGGSATRPGTGRSRGRLGTGSRVHGRAEGPRS